MCTNTHPSCLGCCVTVSHMPGGAVTWNRNKQCRRISPALFRLKVPGVCAAHPVTRSPGPGKAEHSLRRGEAPYLCSIGHGLRFCSRIHCGEERDPMRLPCTLLPSILSPKLAHPSFFPRESMFSLLFPSCLQPFRFNDTPIPGSGPGEFSRGQWTD